MKLENRLTINVPDGAEVSTRDDLSRSKRASARAFQKANEPAPEARGLDANYVWTKLPSAPAANVAAIRRKQLKSGSSRR